MRTASRPSALIVALFAVLLTVVLGAFVVGVAAGRSEETQVTTTTVPPPTSIAGLPSTTSPPVTTVASLPTLVTAGTAPPSSPTVAETTITETAMTLTIDLAPEAVWEDGSPITVADLRCTWRANLNTPGSLSPVGYDRITSVRPGTSDKQAVVSFSEPYAAYRDLFDAILKADAVRNCNDVSRQFATRLPFSGGPFRLQSWGPARSVLIPNENYWGDAAQAPQVDMLARPDPGAEIVGLLRAELDFIYPQFFVGIEDELTDPVVAVERGYGGDFEALYLQVLNGPFADPVYREAFWRSIDVDAFYDAVYSTFADGRPRLTCGPAVPGPYCPDDVFDDTFDPDGAAELLAANGWARDAQGFWSREGVVPEIRWMVNSGSARREFSQDYLIPLLAQAGFKVVADNCVAECVFDQRLPALDYDLAMFGSTAAPDPGYLTSAFSCENVPSIDNDFRGQNQQGWCNEEASALLEQADLTIDPDARAALVQDAIRLMESDHVMHPLFEIPQIAAYRSDRIGGTIGDEVNDHRAFVDVSGWTDGDGDGRVVIGAEQWPLCLNPVTECADVTWFDRAVREPLLPAVWSVTNEGDYEITDLVSGEPVVALIAPTADTAADATETTSG